MRYYLLNRINVKSNHAIAGDDDIVTVDGVIRSPSSGNR